MTRIFSLSRDSISMKLRFASGDLGEPRKHGTRIKRLLSCNSANVDVKETAILIWSKATDAAYTLVLQLRLITFTKRKHNKLALEVKWRCFNSSFTCKRTRIKSIILMVQIEFWSVVLKDSKRKENTGGNYLRILYLREKFNLKTKHFAYKSRQKSNN